MDDQVIKDFEGKLEMFENSLKSIADNFMSKLDELSVQAEEVAKNTAFLKKMKTIYDEQNKKLMVMDATIDELQTRLNKISEQPYKSKRRKK